MMYRIAEHLLRPLLNEPPMQLAKGEFGGRVGIWRLIALFDSHDIKATIFTPGRIRELYPEALRAAFSYHPPYYHFDERATNYVDYGPQNSRGFRALKVWLALRQVGAAGYRRMISDDIRLSRALAAAVGRHPDLELMTQDLSITTFRYVPRDVRADVGDEQTERYLDALNRELLDRLQRGGEVFVSNAVIRGRYALRACIVNFHTDLVDAEALPDIVVRVAQRVDADLRPTAAR